MNRVLSFCLLLQIVSCKNIETKEQIVTIPSNKIELVEVVVEKVVPLDSIKFGLNFKPKGNYNAIKNQIGLDKVYFKSLYESNPDKAIDSVSKYLYTKLLNDIVPHWYNTPWNFNGHTNVPNKGEIACGYFVSTTLKHLGFNLNRYRMAQQGGMNEAKTLQSKPELKIFSKVSFSKLKERLNSVYKGGVYFVGLDNHVGYVVLKDEEVYFLHSSYYDNMVIMELAEESPCFASDIYVFAEITSNKGLIRKWILNEELLVPIN